MARLTLTQLADSRLFATRETVEKAEFAALAALAIALPLVLQHPQLLVGSVVNFALIVAGTNVRSWTKLLPLIVLPAVAAVAGGMLFGESVFVGLLFLMPVIWSGNAALVFFFKRLHVVGNWGFAATLLAAGASKTVLIGAGTALLVLAGLLPMELLIAMVPLQLLTVMLGGLAAWPLGWVYRLSIPREA